MTDEEDYEDEEEEEELSDIGWGLALGIVGRFIFRKKPEEP